MAQARRREGTSGAVDAIPVSCVCKCRGLGFRSGGGNTDDQSPRQCARS